QPLSAMYGVEMVSGQRLPLIQVPTTAGTGSEATAVAIVTTGESTKAGVVSSILFADHIVLDPELTLGLPAHVTAATGIDAMVHAIEAFTSARLKNPLSDMVALKALQLLSKNIVTAVQTGSDLEARSDMLLGAMLAGQAFANAPVGAVHALAYPLGGTYHIPHGLSNSLVLPHVLRFNAPAANDLYFEISQVMHGLDSSSISSANAGQELANYFADLASSLGLQTQLRQMNIKPEALEDLASQSMNQQRLLINNPRVVELADALAIYQQAY
ncbi:MAG: alcohol dehydrogenase class IV, partial [Neolewinella sp.]